MTHTLIGENPIAGGQIEWPHRLFERMMGRDTATLKFHHYYIYCRITTCLNIRILRKAMLAYLLYLAFMAPFFPKLEFYYNVYDWHFLGSI